MKMYQRTDSFLKKLMPRIRREINRLRVTAFDELNVIQTKRATEGMFSRLVSFSVKEYAEICRQARKWAVEQLTPEERRKLKKDDFDPVEEVALVLASYDPVTQYLFYPEADRKRARLAEGINATREALDRAGYDKLLMKNANLLRTQLGQYPISVEDRTVVDTWKAAGVLKVVWHTARDDKVCAECNSLDRKVFAIDNIPDKPHYNCRCWVTPAR